MKFVYDHFPSFVDPGYLIRRHGIRTTYAFGTNILTALLINYAMRKFVIFSG